MSRVTDGFAGTGALLRLFARRDRVRVPVWIVSLVGLAVGSAASVIDIYDTPQQLATFARIVEGNAAVIATNGRAEGLETIGGRVSFEVLVFTALMAALMSLLLVNRHTRGEEEAGRTELVRAGVVGIRAQPAAALLLVTAVNLVVGGLIAGGLVALDLPAGGSAVLAGGIATVGIVFAAVAAVTAQVSEHARTAGGLAGAVLGAAFALRAVGDVGAGWPSWLSPIGWAQAAGPFTSDRWWPLGLGLVVAAFLAGVAFWLVGTRDVRGGLVAPRPGPASASPSLDSPLPLAVRLQRGSVAGWAAGVAALAVVYGAIGLEVEELLASTPEVAEFLTAGVGTPTEVFFASAAVQIGLVTSGYAIQGLLRLGTEEADGRAELLLGTPVSRLRWVGSHLVTVAGGCATILAVSGGAAGLVHGLRAGDLSWVATMTGATLAQLPAVLVIGAVTLLLYGISTRLALVAWATLAGGLVIVFFGEALRLPQWVRDLSPFTHLPDLPAADLAMGPPLVLLAIATALGAAGLVAFRHRDLATT